MMPEQPTSERLPSVPETKNGASDAQLTFELQVQLFELQRAERLLQRERERYQREQERLVEAQKESAQEVLKADALSRTANESTQKLIELDMRMGKTEQLKALVQDEKLPPIAPLRSAAKTDRALAQIMDGYDAVKKLYETSVQPWPAATDKQRHLIAASAVAMREALLLGQNRLESIQKNSKTAENQWLKLQRIVPLGTSPALLESMIASGSLDAIFKDLQTRASALFSTPDKPAIDAKMAEMAAYLPNDERALGIADAFMTQLQRFVSLTSKAGANGESSIGSDPEELSQVEDAITWMERSADALKKYADDNPRVKQYLDGALPRAVAESSATDNEEPKNNPEQNRVISSEPAARAYPEQINAQGQTVSTSDDVFHEWEERWIEAGKDSFFDTINARYTSFREIRRENKENQKVIDAYAVILPLLKRYTELESSIPRLTGQEAKVSDMSQIEQVLIDLDKALTAFEAAWQQKESVQNSGASINPKSELAAMANRLWEEGASTEAVPDDTKKKDEVNMSTVTESATTSTEQFVNPVAVEQEAVQQAQESPMQTVEVAPPQQDFSNSLAEYFRQPGGIERLNTRVEAMFAKYQELLNDKPTSGGSIEWQTYAQEAKQLTSRYLLALTNGGWSADPSKQVESLAVIHEFEGLLEDYQANREEMKNNPPPEKDDPWHDAAAEALPLADRMRLFTENFNALAKEYGKAVTQNKPELSNVAETWKTFMADYETYRQIYLVADQRKDKAMLGTALSQMERLAHYYEPKLKEASSVVEAQPTSGGAFSFNGLLNSANNIVKNAVKSGSEDPELQRKVTEKMFQAGQSRFDIRQNLILGSTLKPLPKLTSQELESLLYIKAHLKEMAGNDGRLNAADVAGVVDSIYRDVMSRPYDLHQAILQERKIQPGSYEDIGLQKALGLVAVMTQQESSQYNKGINAENRPLSRWLFKTFRAADYNRLQQAKVQLNQLAAVQAQIPFEVRKKIDAQIMQLLTKSHVPSYSRNRDTGHAALTQKQMQEFEKHAAVLKSVSERALKDVRDLTGAKVETYLPDGLSIEFIDWMLDAQTRPDGRKGTAPGSYFWIEGAPVNRAKDRKSVIEGPVATDTRESPPEEISLEIDLGDSSSDPAAIEAELRKPQTLN